MFESSRLTRRRQRRRFRKRYNRFSRAAQDVLIVDAVDRRFSFSVF